MPCGQQQGRAALQRCHETCQEPPSMLATLQVTATCVPLPAVLAAPLHRLLPPSHPSLPSPPRPAGRAGHRAQRRREHHAGPGGGRAQLRLLCGRPLPDAQAAARGRGAPAAGQAAGGVGVGGVAGQGGGGFGVGRWVLGTRGVAATGSRHPCQKPVAQHRPAQGGRAKVLPPCVDAGMVLRL